MVAVSYCCLSLFLDGHCRKRVRITNSMDEESPRKPTFGQYISISFTHPTIPRSAPIRQTLSLFVFRHLSSSLKPNDVACPRMFCRCLVNVLLSHTTAPSSTAPAASLPLQGQLNPAQIAMAAARNLGVHSALPAQPAAGLAGFGAGAAFQSNPQLLAQLMRPAQQQATPGQCKIVASKECEGEVKFLAFGTDTNLHVQCLAHSLFR